MKLAIIGSRDVSVDISKYIAEEPDEIVSGGARGIDTCAAEYASKKGIKLIEFLPEYSRYGRGAPLKRNEKIAEYADEAIALWDGRSKGTKYAIELFKRLGKRVEIVIINND